MSWGMEDARSNVQWDIFHVPTTILPGAGGPSAAPTSLAMRGIFPPHTGPLGFWGTAGAAGATEFGEFVGLHGGGGIDGRAGS